MEDTLIILLEYVFHSVLTFLMVILQQDIVLDIVQTDGMPILLIIFVFLTVLNHILVIIQHGDVFNNAQEAKIYLGRR